ncbi:MAG: hypothetical protein SFU86_14915 [Pirellulaceae bacterium]|nr:hypothetical protein [Pirellulaceae bacterium]
MVIKFLCPNGHQLSAPDNMVGKKGKCPKCQTAFVVPEPVPDEPDALPPPEGGPAPAAESSAPEPAAAGSAPSGASPSASGPGLATDSGEFRSNIGTGSGTSQGSGVFVFLCPNGHKLNGPPSLKGKPGKCPHCGARFRIPTDDEIEEEQEEEEVPTGESEPEEEEIADGQPDEEQGGFNFNFGQQEEVVEGEPDEPPLEFPPPGSPALGYIFGRLWDRKDEQSEIEIFLTEGEIMTPDHYSEILSTSDYGVFAVKEGDGTYAITVIPWSAVRRIGMRKVTELSPQAFR